MNWVRTESEVHVGDGATGNHCTTDHLDEELERGLVTYGRVQRAEDGDERSREDERDNEAPPG